MDKIEELLNNKELADRLNTCVDAERVRALAAEFGTELTAEEAQQIISLLKFKLTEADLSSVTGGTTGGAAGGATGDATGDAKDGTIEKQGNTYGLKICKICGKSFHGGYRWYEPLCYDCYNAGYR